MDAVERLTALLDDAAAITVFTGAGVSTESGIPDFRSPGGVWTRYDPREMTFERYVASAEVRATSWALRREFLAADPQPNAAHRAIARLEAEDRSPGVVTQNIDGLHQAAGSQTVVELHGTGRMVMCIGQRPRAGVPQGCAWRADTQWAFDAIAAGEADPSCPECGGLVKSATISFGQMLDPGVVDAAVALVEAADVLLVVGSSLQIYPAAALPEEAVMRGARLAIVNAEPTPFDDLADVVVRGRAGEVLAAAVGA